MLAIIGGSGLTRLSTLAVAHREVVRTPYGEPSSALIFGQIADRDVVFLARHGHGHTIPPHRVNYRANLWALKARGVDAILAVASVGAHRAHRTRRAISFCRIKSSTTAADAKRRSSTAAIAPWFTSTSRTRTRPPCVRAVSPPRPMRRFRFTMAVSTRPCRARAWKPRRRSTASSATARRSSA